jgi:tetratricopeptide (TPR) repeat protein
MPETCARHSAHAAWWQCPRCFKTLCPLCIARKPESFDGAKTLYLCPICGVEARYIELFRVLASLWERLPRFLAYPFSAGTSAALIPALALLATMSAQRGLFSAAAYFVIGSVSATYAFATLQSTSSGSFQPPPLTKRNWDGGLATVFRQIAIYSVFYLLFLFLISRAHIWVLIATTIVCAMVFPAILALLSIEKKLFRALNPLFIMGLIGRIGRSYYQLVCFWLMLIGMVAIIGDIAGSYLPGWCRIFATAAAINFAAIVAYHMTGYVILQYHHCLDYPVDLENLMASLDNDGPLADQDAEMQTRATANDDLLIAINRLMERGNLKGAIRQFEMQTKAEQIHDLDLSQRYLELLRLDKRPGKFLTHAAHHLELLAKSGYNSKALSLYMECIRMDKNFAPQALVLFKLAGWLDDSGKSREAVYVLNCLIKYHPQNTMVPKALYRVAQIFHQGMKDVERSKKVLAGLIQRFPDHEITAFAKNYLVSIQK